MLSTIFFWHVKSILGRGLLFSCHGHLSVESYTDVDGFITDRRSTSGYCTFFGGNLVIWSKKQVVVARLSAETKF